MRVAVHHPDESVSAFRLGRITDQVNPVTGDTTPKDEVAEQLIAAAKLEYPDCEIVLERLVDNGDETSTWVSADDVPEDAVGPEGVVIETPEIIIEQTQETP